MSTSFVHVGITVSDIDKAGGVYIKYFGFKKKYEFLFNEKFFQENLSLFRQPEGVFADMQMIESPDGVVLELFRFSNAESGGAEWQRTGWNHIALRVDDLPGLYAQMKMDGVEFFMAPKIRSDGSGHWVYLKDPDGNMLELWD